MEEVINDMIDTISNILITFEDSMLNSNKILIVNTTIQLEKAILFLIGLAKKNSNHWNLDSKEKMDLLISNLNNSLMIIDSFNLQNIYHEEDGKKILEEIKKMMIYSIEMLKLDDEQKINKILICSKKCIDSISRLLKIENKQSIFSLINEIYSDISTLNNHLTKRYIL